MPDDKNPKPTEAYRSQADPRKHEDEGVLIDAAQAQNGSGFKGDGTRPEQNSDWYGTRRPDPAVGADKADPAHLQAAGAKKPAER